MSNGDKLEGEFKKDYANGYGVYYFSNGNKYEGQFKEDTFYGYGVLYFSKEDKFEGEFTNDKKMYMEYIISQMEIDMKVNL